jgi:hypothetical protein
MRRIAALLRGVANALDPQPVVHIDGRYIARALREQRRNGADGW